MHPIVGDRRRLRTFAVLWIPVGVLVTVLPLWWVGGNLEDAWAVVLWGEALAVPALAFWYVYRFTALSASTEQILITIIMATLATTALWLGAGRAWLWLVSSIAPSPSALFPRFAPMTFAAGAMVLAVMSAVHYAIAAGDEGRAAAARALHADVAAREAELRALRSQVNPHFLFNCLHSISALMLNHPEDARRMCLELADFFRDSLRAGALPRIPIEFEAALVRRYLDIERVRFGERLRATITVAPEVERALVPPLLLQPLAENAVRHGIATLVDGGDIAIAVTRQGNRVSVAIDNAFDPDGRRPGTGVGLANVRARLETSFGSDASLRVDTEDARFRATVSLPYLEAPAA
jgi:two-component system sensor histidine kinase AlgZ